MTNHYYPDNDEPSRNTGDCNGQKGENRNPHAGHGHGKWMMLLCLLPMLFIGFSLLRGGKGLSGVPFLFILCPLLHILMFAGIRRGRKG